MATINEYSYVYEGVKSVSNVRNLSRKFIFLNLSPSFHKPDKKVVKKISKRKT